MKSHHIEELNKGKNLVILVRHGDKLRRNDKSIPRVPGLGLSSRGKKQTKELSKDLKKFGKVDLVYSSSMTRAKETAEIIAKNFKKKVRVLDDFYEMRKDHSLGFLRNFSKEGKRFKKIVSTFKNILKENKGKVIVFALHGRVIRSLLGEIMEIPYKKRERIVVNNCHVTFLRFYKDIFEVLYCLNSNSLEYNK